MYKKEGLMPFKIKDQEAPYIKDLNIYWKTVLLRVDLNVPLEGDNIISDFKLLTILPTLDYLLSKNCKIVLATHIGRPVQYKPPYSYIEELSCKKLSKWFTKKGYKIKLTSDLDEAKTLIKELPTDEILLLENLRFYSGEQQNDESFAKKLAELAEVFINDAFGAIHRNDTSVTLLSKLFPKGNKAFGFLMEKEIENLSKLKYNQKRPFIVICGGDKVESKVEFLKSLVTRQDRPNEILIGGVIANTIFAMQGLEIGNSKIDKNSFKTLHEFLNLARENSVKILLPKDCLMNFETDFRVFHVGHFMPDGNCIDIGPQTIDSFKRKIENARTILVIGTMGIYNDPISGEGTKSILAAVSKSHAFSVVGGGDTTAAALLFNQASHIDFMSTGGGATLAFLSNDEINLPSIKNMIE